MTIDLVTGLLIGVIVFTCFGLLEAWRHFLDDLEEL